ncbi:MAG: N-acetylneuraminate synthase family protein [Candidatus Margulisbacteria bacterium]|nr:N-acetylneuraminate synthase family protein [Candidatus Margulisiibacteriota bacterium]MBU1021536.1 N-acetylneuraminate synthase family protein [Candidatus Margulisiibacteriota bacterium]MBU1728622.1 N-acetylneuraminate synthase family protein [Candidatus Margulisiibacteriota bacterium]MBU1955073.1 N-acetylneuraminate synthase family protein [Candidatus Margulisiibacteriota bacterium]
MKTKVDAIKFQPIIAREFMSFQHSMFKVFKSLEFSRRTWQQLGKRVKKSGKKLLFDVYGEVSLKFALEAGADILKIHAMDFDNFDFIKTVLKHKKPLIISTGGATIDEIDQVMKVTKGHPICLMVGFQNFPTPATEANLDRIDLLKKRFGCPIGFMDHVGNDSVFAMVLPCLALLRGASTIEKHVYLKTRKTKYDWQSALDPKAIDDLAVLLRNTLDAKGKDKYVLSKLENNYREKYRKNAVAKRDLSKGKKVKAGDIEFLRGEFSKKQTPIYRKDMPGLLSKGLKRKVVAGQTLVKEMF